MKKFYLFLMTGIIALAFTACGGQKKNADGREAVDLTGAGATFPLPFYTMSFKTYGESHADKGLYHILEVLCRLRTTGRCALSGCIVLIIDKGITKLEHELLCGLRSDSGNPRQSRKIPVVQCPDEVVDRNRGKYLQRPLACDSRNLEQLDEAFAFTLVLEAVESHGILAYLEDGENPDDILVEMACVEG